MYRKSLTTSKQQGAALITALLIVAITVGLVSVFVVRQRIALRRTQQMFNSDKAYFYALGVEDWAISVLAADIDAPSHPWPITFGPTSIPGGSVMGEIEDAQARFNLNNLNSGADEFIRLLLNLNTPMTLARAQTLVQSIRAWEKKSNDAPLIRAYQEHEPPYHPAQRLLTSVSELRLIDGVDATLFQALLPMVFALPEVTAININTAPLAVLMTLDKTTTLASAQSIIAYRVQNNGIKSLNELKNIPDFADYKIDKKRMTIKSNYFLVSAYVTLGKQQFIMYSLLNRTKEKRAQKTSVKIVTLWHSQGMY